MLKETITCTDYNGVEYTEDHYFNLTKAELMEMEISWDGGLSEHIKRIVEANNNREIYNLFKEIILKAYGVKSADGKRFMKKDPVDGHLLANDFEQTEAFSELVIKLASDEKAASAFINGIIPQNLNK